LGALVLITIILRRALISAHLCVRLLAYKVFVKSSWYHFEQLAGIIFLSLLCFSLSFFSSIIMVKLKSLEQILTCEDKQVYVTLNDSYNSWILWAVTFGLSCYFYWPVVNHIIDLYDTPHKIFIEPEILLIKNAEANNDGQLLKRLSEVRYQVRVHHVKDEAKKILKELGRCVWWKRLDVLEDWVLELVIYRLMKKNKLKRFRKKENKSNRVLAKIFNDVA